MHSSAPVTVAEQQVASLGTKRTLAFITPDPAAGTPKRPSSSARELLTAHLTKLSSLSPTLTLADGSTRALRILSLHPAHLFRAGTLLTGTLYLTTTHVLFCAYLRPRAPKLADAPVAATRDERMVRLRCNKPTRHQRSPSAAIYLNTQLPIVDSASCALSAHRSQILISARACPRARLTTAPVLSFCLRSFSSSSISNGGKAEGGSLGRPAPFHFSRGSPGRSTSPGPVQALY